MINTGVIVGNLTRDPESKEYNGKTITNFSIAYNKYKKGGGDPDVYYFDCTAFDKQAEFIRDYIKKGTKATVEYSLKQDRWKDKETGVQRSKITLTVNRFVPMSKKEDGSSSPPVGEDEIPF